MCVEEGSVKPQSNPIQGSRAIVDGLAVSDNTAKAVRPQRFRDGKLTHIAGVPVTAGRPPVNSGDTDLSVEHS